MRALWRLGNLVSSDKVSAGLPAGRTTLTLASHPRSKPLNHFGTVAAVHACGDAQARNQKLSGANVATVHEAERMSVKSVGVSQMNTSSAFTLLFLFVVCAASPKSVDV